jgi:hypothetical protein
MSEQELLLCPCCGGEAITERDQARDERDTARAEVERLREEIRNANDLASALLGIKEAFDSLRAEHEALLHRLAGAQMYQIDGEELTVIRRPAEELAAARQELGMPVRQLPFPVGE